MLIELGIDASGDLPSQLRCAKAVIEPDHAEEVDHRLQDLHRQIMEGIVTLRPLGQVRQTGARLGLAALDDLAKTEIPPTGIVEVRDAPGANQGEVIDLPTMVREGLAEDPG